MKQLLILAAAFLTLSATAQTREADALKSKLEKNDAAVADAKKGAMARTWIERANIKMDMATVFTNTLIAGIPAEQLISDMMAGKPNSIEEVTIGGVALTKYVYNHFDVYSNMEGIVQFWDARTIVMPGALESAYGDLVKAKALGAKEFTGSGRGAQAVDRLTKDIVTGASNAYSLDKKDESAKFFELSADAKSLIGILDTTSYFNAGVVYFENNKFDKALPFFEKVAALNYMPDGTMFYYLATCQDKLGEKEKALATAEKGFKLYPQNPNVMTVLINLYIASNQNPEKLIGLVHEAQKMDDKNPSLYRVEGDVYVKLGDYPNAYKAVEKALALDANNFTTLYNYGMMMVNESDALAKEAQKLPLSDTKGFDALKARMNELRVSAVRQFEKAYAVDTANQDLVLLLSQLSYLVRDQNDDMKAIYEKFSELYKNNAQ